MNTINANINATCISTNDEENEEITNSNWSLEIPKIKLSAQIEEGTTPEILDEYIGHFEDTSKENGNIALAAHNRGYNVNYFEKLKELEIGDDVIYTFKNHVRIYKISSKDIIKDTDVKILEKTDENILTLITCVENEPELRRCLIAKEIKSKEN